MDGSGLKVYFCCRRIQVKSNLPRPWLCIMARWGPLATESIPDIREDEKCARFLPRVDSAQPPLKWWGGADLNSQLLYWWWKHNFGVGAHTCECALGRRGGLRRRKSWSKMAFPKKNVIRPILLSFWLWRTEQTIKTKAPARNKLRQMTTCLKVTPTLRPVRMGLELPMTLKPPAWPKSFRGSEPKSSGPGLVASG